MQHSQPLTLSFILTIIQLATGRDLADLVKSQVAKDLALELSKECDWIYSLKNGKSSPYHGLFPDFFMRWDQGKQKLTLRPCTNGGTYLKFATADQIPGFDEIFGNNVATSRSLDEFEYRLVSGS